MKTHVLIGIAILEASLAVPEAFGQKVQADLDHMPIFGMPAHRVDRKRTDAEISTTGMPSGPYLGIETQDVTAGRAGAAEVHAVEVTLVEAAGPASKSGFEVGDIVLDYNGQPVRGKAELSQLMEETPAGQQVKISVRRAGVRLVLTATMEAFPTRPGIQAPTLISKVVPELTPLAQKAGIQGTVIVYVEIGTDGRVHPGRVVKGLGYGLDARAMTAVAHWRFSPGKENGVPVITPATIEVNFQHQ